MKRFIISLIMVMGFMFMMTMTCYGQVQAYEYFYDAAGNRSSRAILTLNSKNAQLDKKDSVAMEQPWGKRLVTIFPNPTKGNLIVKIQGGDEDALYDMRLYNTNGSLLMEKTGLRIGDHPVRMETFEPGNYILILMCNEEKLSYKIIKK